MIREEPRKTEKTKRISSAEENSLLSGFPVAAFRTNRRLEIVDATGDLWEEFGVTRDSLIGGDLTGKGTQPLPRFLLDIDYCDTMAGLTLQSDVAWQDESYVITMEPFLDRHQKVMGSVGMIRKTKQVEARSDAEHLRFPKPEDYTQSLKKTRKVELSMPGEKPDEISKIRSSIRPRRLSPGDLQAADKTPTEPVALAN
ncbi:MAG: hypothetical protein AAGC68_17115 [Verrucomicrobiota bacterium]